MKTATKSTYHNHAGRHQADYDRLRGELVPDSGPAPTTRGEVLRAMARLYHDYYNNGFINLGMGSYVFGLYGVLCVHAGGFCRTPDERVAWRKVAGRIDRHLKDDSDTYVEGFPEAAFETVADAVVRYVTGMHDAAQA